MQVCCKRVTLSGNGINLERLACSHKSGRPARRWAAAYWRIYRMTAVISRGQRAGLLGWNFIGPRNPAYGECLLALSSLESLLASLGV